MKHCVALVAAAAVPLFVTPLCFAAYPDTNIAQHTTAIHEHNNPWMVRTRAIVVDPQPSSNTIHPGLGGHVDEMSTEPSIEFDVNYFFTPHISAELILATTKHNVTAKGTVLGEVELGSVNALPPTLTAVYHFLPNSRINPYIGAGINYTFFYDANSGAVATDIDYTNSFGPALQAGFDVAIDEHWSFNVDVKKIYMSSDVKVETNLLPTQKTDVDINPFIFGVGFGYKFS